MTGGRAGTGPTVVLVGLCTVDLVQRVRELPEAGQKIQSDSVELVAGGPATNAAVTVAALGGTARLLTALGAHPLADVVRDDLRECQVRVFDAFASFPGPPPVSSVAVRAGDGERVVVAHNAAGMPDLLTQPSWPSLLAGAGALLVDGHHPALAVSAARAARGRDIPVMLDAGSDKPVLSQLLPLVDVCACSADFRLGRSGQRATERAIHELGVPVVIRTNGAGPVRWSVRTAQGRTVGGSVSPPQVPARDTLAAGDVWHGALARRIAELGQVPTEDDLPELIDAANRIAALRVATPGARAWLAELRS
ncbi:MAG TPA: PfkB family carbohydrate kinase [Pseudonocardiaceae bacterium]|nr:PfkB family carbohydrate kinase [Pseudonocardiaceae bacterium]